MRDERFLVATCNPTRHRYRWVSTWGPCGFMECSVCGDTDTYGPVPSAAPLILGDAVVMPMHLASAAIGAGLAVAGQGADASLAGMNVKTNDDVGNTTHHPPKRLGGLALLTRNRAIHARVAAGENRVTIAADYGIGYQSVWQIGKDPRWADVPAPAAK